MGSTLQRCQLLLKMPGVVCFQHHQYRHTIYGGRVSLFLLRSAVRSAGKPREALGRWEGRASFHHVVEAQADEDGLLKKKQLDMALDHIDQVCTLPIYLSLLKACVKAKSLSHAKRIHAHLAAHHVDLSGPLSEHLIMTLAKCGGLDDALHLFDTLPHPTVFSWTSIMAAFTDSGHGREALQMYLCMQDEGVEPDSYTFVCLFKACGNIPDLEYGKTLHHEACQGGFASYVYVSNTLVSMYGKCTAIAEAENVFSRLSYCNVVSWNSMLSAYIDNSHGQKALLAFRQMIEEGLSPNKQSFLMALKACGTLKANLIEDQSIKSISLEIGQALHAEAHKKGFASDVFVGTTIVSMYGTCGTIMQAENAFTGLSLRNTVSWNAMISAYIDQDQEESALQLYRQMQEEGVSLDQQTFLITLQACGAFADKVEALVMERQSTKVMSLEIGQALHVDAKRNGFASDPFVGNTLVSMYGKCGTIVEAETVFCCLWQRSVVSWTAMLSAFVDQQQGEKAIQLYRQMQEEGPGQNWQTLMMALQACGTLADNEEANLVEGIFIKTMSLEIGQALHAESRRKGFTSYPFVGNTLVSMYGKCGTIMEAENVFVVLSQHNVVSWTAMLSAYVEQGQGEKALQLYRQMQLEMVSPDHQTFVVALRACVSLAGKGGDICLQIGQALHFDAWKRGFATHVFVGSALLRMYSRCGTIAEAENVFSGLTQRNFVSWTAMLSACIEQRQGEKALELYRQLKKEGLSPNEQMFVMALQACAILAEKEEYSVVEGQVTKVMALEIGRALHADARRNSFTSHAFVGTTLIYMYGKSGAIVEAENVFGDLFQRSVVSWNVMLAAYVEHGHGEKALQLYTQMQEEGVNSNQQTFIAALQACRILADKEEGIFVEGGRSIKLMSVEIGHVLHADAQMKAFSLDLFVANTLVSMYGKCGLIEDAEKVFNGLSQEDIVSWNVMLSAYVEQNQAEKALKLYRQMEKELVTMDDITLMSVLQACSEAGSLESCWQLHFNVVFAEHDLNSSLASTLLYAYGSCASMVDAQAVFDRLPQPDVVSWSACIAGYAGQENYIATFQMFEEMQLAGIKPDGVTFTSLLFACSHAGLVDTGVQYLEFMSRCYGVNLDLKHYVSILDLLGRAGDFKMVENIFSKMPMQADLTIWLCLLGACRKHANVELGKQVFDHAVKLQPKETAPYILMSSIYTDAGLQGCVDVVENSWQKQCVVTEPPA